MIMTKTAVTPGSRKGFTSADKQFLIEEIHQLAVCFDYMNAGMFRNIVSHVVSAFLRGRQIDKTHSLSKTIPSLIRFARQTRTPTPATLFVVEYAKKARKANIEAAPLKEYIFQTLAREIWPKTCLPLDNFGYAISSELGESVIISTLHGFMHVFENIDEMRRLGNGLHLAASEIEKARTIVKLEALPEDTAARAIEQFEQQCTANAWLYPVNDPNKSGLVPADDLFAVVRTILERIQEPLTVRHVATSLGVSEMQARKWLERLAKEDS